MISGSSGDESDTSHGVPSSLDTIPRCLDVVPLSPSSDSYYNRDIDKKVSSESEIRISQFTASLIDLKIFNE